MAKIYNVYNAQTGQIVFTRRNKEQAIGDVDALCDVNQISGLLEVHELDEEADRYTDPVVVYRRRA